TRRRWYQPATVARNIDPALPPVGAGAAGDARLSRRSDVAYETCVVCNQRFELAEFVGWPFHQGAICAVCCASEGACREMCKSGDSGAGAEREAVPAAGSAGVA